MDNENKNIIELPCNIGDTVYIVEDYNTFYDKCEYYTTIYNTKIVIKRYIVETFIVDNEGVSIAENGHDECNKLSTYHDLTLEKYGDCKIFYNEEDAINFVKSVSR